MTAAEEAYATGGATPAWILQYLHNVQTSVVMPRTCGGTDPNNPACQQMDPSYKANYLQNINAMESSGINPSFWTDYTIPDTLPATVPAINFWEQYNQFMPLMSNQTFGSNMLANLGGSFATLQGGLMPYTNQQYAMTGPEGFPVDQVQNAANQVLTDNSSSQPGAQNLPTLLTKWSQNIGLGILAIGLIIAGIIYLALQNDKVKAAAKDAAMAAVV